MKNQDRLLISLEDKLFPSTITKVVEIEEGLIVCVCGADGKVPLQMPYFITESGDISGYDMRDKESRKQFYNGNVIFQDLDKTV